MPRQQISIRELKVMEFTNSPNLPNIIKLRNTYYQWLGIGWVECAITDKYVEIIEADKIEVMRADCGCVVEKNFRLGRLPLYVIAGQDDGISEMPFSAGGNSDRYLANCALNNGCPHKRVSQ